MGERRIGGLTEVVQKVLTVAAATYTADDMLGSAETELTGVIVPSTVGGGGDNTGWIVGVELVDDNNNTVNAEVIFWDAEPSNTTFTDEAVFDPDERDMENLIGVVKIDDWVSFSNVSVGTAANPRPLGFNLGAGTSLFVAVKTKGTPVYAATDDLTLILSIVADS